MCLVTCIDIIHTETIGGSGWFQVSLILYEEV